MKPFGAGNDLRRAFKTPEGSYQLKFESRHGQVPYQDRQTSRLTICSIPEGSVKGDYIILNVGDAIYILQYGENEGDSVKVVYFRRDAYPTCHCFVPSQDEADVLVGLSNGEVMLLSLRAMLQGVSYNSQATAIATFSGGRRLDEDISVTSVIWSSNPDPTHFIATYSDGNLRIFEKPRSGNGIEVRSFRTIHPTETTDIGGGCIHDAAISPDGTKLAIASKDGLLRIFSATSRELQTGFQSYYGGLLCCAWSPDSQYVATGGEDDLVTVFGLHQGAVVAFGEGHSSWISQVAFDFNEESTSESAVEPHSVIYRVGSVSQDTQVALWDFEVDLSIDPSEDSRIANQLSLSANGAMEESEEEPMPIAPAIPHREMVIIPPVMLHKLHPDPVTDIVFTKHRMFTCDCSGHVRYWAKPDAYEMTRSATSLPI